MTGRSNSNKQKRAILVTGAAGYLGTFLVPSLLQRGYAVRAYDSMLFGSDFLKKSLPFPVETIRRDIRDITPDDINDCDTVIHLAAISNDPTAEYDPDENIEVNFRGTEHLARVAKNSGVERFIYANTCSVYHGPYCETEFDETMPLAPTAAYAQSKYLGEQALAACADRNFRVVSLRQGTIHGFSPRMRYDLVLNTFCKCTRESGVLTVNCEGKEWRPVIDIRDATDIFLRCLEFSCDDNMTIINAVSENILIGDLALKVKEAALKKISAQVDLRVLPGAPQRSYRASNARIKKLLGFAPRYSLDDSIADIFSKLEAGLCTDFSNPVYYNIRWFREKEAECIA